MRTAKPAGEPDPAGKAAVLVVRAKDAAAGGEERKKRPGSQEPAAAAEQPLPVVVVPSAPVRTSSCTKEEVDAILIQCGRLSRSSSGAGRAASSGAAAGHRRRRSGSKRSYDFDQDARSGGGADEDWERQGTAAVSRPSPHRGSPQRKRSGSRERSGGGGSGSRRASRSPGRRTDGAAASAATAGSSGGGEHARQQPQSLTAPLLPDGLSQLACLLCSRRPSLDRLLMVANSISVVSRTWILFTSTSGSSTRCCYELECCPSVSRGPHCTNLLIHST